MSAVRLLALETGDEVASVALLYEGGALEKTIDSSLRHAQTVMPAVDALLQQAGLEPKDITAVAVDVGPGSFTGIRIGVCHGNALGQALHIPLIEVNALESIAHPALHQNRPVCALIDARNGNGYGALYQADGSELIPPCACEVEAFLRQVPENAILLGSGYPEALNIAHSIPKAIDIAYIAGERVSSAQNGRELRPMYLRPSRAKLKGEA